MCVSFGFADGISQPAIDVDSNKVTTLPGQRRVPQGIVLLGRDGEDTGGNARPSWVSDCTSPGYYQRFWIA